MAEFVTSKNGVDIRLTNERWQHIIAEHAELSASKEEVLKTIAEPERILAGKDEELLAVREIESGKWMIVVGVS